jgi:hypothetical protein
MSILMITEIPLFIFKITLWAPLTLLKNQMCEMWVFGCRISTLPVVLLIANIVACCRRSPVTL